MFKAQASEAAVAYWPMHCNAGDKLVEIVNEMQLMLQTRQGQMRSVVVVYCLRLLSTLLIYKYINFSLFPV